MGAPNAAFTPMRPPPDTTLSAALVLTAVATATTVVRPGRPGAEAQSARRTGSTWAQAGRRGVAASAACGLNGAEVTATALAVAAVAAASAVGILAWTAAAGEGEGCPALAGRRATDAGRWQWGWGIGVGTFLLRDDAFGGDGVERQVGQFPSWLGAFFFFLWSRSAVQFSESPSGWARKRR